MRVHGLLLGWIGQSKTPPVFESLFSTLVLVVSFIFILTEPLFLLLSHPDDTEMDREDDRNVNLGDNVDRSRTVDE